MARHLALCFDGTWNTPDDRTNPWRFHNYIAPATAEGVTQLVYYDEGVGAHWYDWFTGGAFGRGLSRNIREAYAWLARHYQEGDVIYIFGFSRGAYTARSLVGLLRKAGLIRFTSDMSAARLDELIGEAYALYRRKDPKPDVEDAKAFRAAHAHVVGVRFIGVWDTVGALGIPFPKIPFSRDYFRFHDTGLSRIVEHACHALAIDEQRKTFAPTLWTKKPETTVMEQRWFVGAHANVGGGYRHDPLPDIGLRWIQDQARSCGLAMTAGVPVDAASHLAPVNDSFREFMYGAYALLRLGRRHHRPIGEAVGEVVDESAITRLEQDPAYRPPELVAYLRRR